MNFIHFRQTAAVLALLLAVSLAQTSLADDSPLLSVQEMPQVQGTDPADDFVTTWNTENPGTSGPTSITIPMIGGPYDVDWNNDGIFDEFGLHGPVTHDFGAPGIRTVRIRGSYSAIRFSNTGEEAKILSIDQWGTGSWQSMHEAFWGAVNLQVPALDTPDFSAVISMGSMFSGAIAANPDTSSWDTGAVTNMALMFNGASAANPDTSGWDTSLVQSMRTMFQGAEIANPDTSGWDTSAVTDMTFMFASAPAANPDTSGWDTSLVQGMSAMFQGAVNANPDTSGWDTGAVTNMSFMFASASAANPDTSGWDTSLVQSMRTMFQSAVNANPDTSGWDTGAVTDMAFMFAGALAANPETGGWDTSLVQGMSAMFQGAVNANPDTSGWNTGAVTNMASMFSGASAANPDTSGWDTSLVQGMRAMFQGAVNANPDTSGWDTGAVTDMAFMFASALAANSDTSGWDTSLVQSTRAMFQGAVNANPDTSGWDTGAVADTVAMFLLASSANPDMSGWSVPSLSDAGSMLNGSALTTANYEALLEAWSIQGLQADVPLGAANNYYCSESAEVARTSLVEDSQWLITDLGRGCAVGGEVSGLQGSGLTLQINGDNDLAVNANGTFAFGSLDNLTDYTVTVAAQPTDPSQTCSVVANGQGTVTGPNVTDVEVTCVIDTFTIGGSLSGLAGGSSVILQNNDGDDLVLNDNGNFTFATALTDGSTYNVTVLSQPSSPSQTCTVTNGSGELSGENVENVEVSCSTDTFTIGGSLSGLADGSSITLQNNDDDDLVLNDNGDFTFATALDDLSSYSVTVLAQPDGQFCTANNANGTLAGDNVDDVMVDCTGIELSLSLDEIQFTGLYPDQTEEQSVTLTNTGQADLVIEEFLAPDAPFGFDPQDCAPLPLALAPGESCTLVLSFSSPSLGSFADELGIISNAGSSPDSVALTGTTTPAPLPVPGLGLPALLLMMMGMFLLARRQAHRLTEHP